MDEPVEVCWTERSLRNARSIKKLILNRFTQKEVLVIETLLEEFEITVSHFPTIYPESKKKEPEKSGHPQENYCLLSFLQ